MKTLTTQDAGHAVLGGASSATNSALDSTDSTASHTSDTIERASSAFSDGLNDVQLTLAGDPSNKTVGSTLGSSKSSLRGGDARNSRQSSGGDNTSEGERNGETSELHIGGYVRKKIRKNDFVGNEWIEAKDEIMNE